MTTIRPPIKPTITSVHSREAGDECRPGRTVTWELGPDDTGAPLFVSNHLQPVHIHAAGIFDGGRVELLAGLTKDGTHVPFLNDEGAPVAFGKPGASILPSVPAFIAPRLVGARPDAGITFTIFIPS